MKPTILMIAIALSGCAPTAPARPMDEVPVRQVRADGAREYRFANGCVVVLQADRAVLVSESAPCQLVQRDIALLYASGD